jgi:hypothetical protein
MMLTKNHREIVSILMFGCIALGVGNSLYNPSQFTDFSHTHIPSFNTSHPNNGWVEDEDTKKYVEHVKSIIENSKKDNIDSEVVDLKKYIVQNSKFISDYISKNSISTFGKNHYTNDLLDIKFVSSPDINKGEINRMVFLLKIENSNHNGVYISDNTFTLINYKDGTNNIDQLTELLSNISQTHYVMDEQEQLKIENKKTNGSDDLMSKIKDLASKIDGYEHDLNNNKNNSEEIKNILEKVNKTLAN